MVVADSLVKKVKGWQLSIRHDLFVARSFPEAETDDMKPYIKSTLKNKPERIIIHCRTNDLKNKIADRILSLTKSSQHEFGKICNKMN